MNNRTDSMIQNGNASADPVVELNSETGLADGFMKARPRLRAMICARLHPLVAARLDASDVMQETFIEANRRLAEFQKDPQLPFFLWLRRLAKQTLARIHRDHLDRAKRDPAKERGLVGAQSEHYRNGLAMELSVSMASPASQVAQKELMADLNTVILSLPTADQEILGLRHLEQLSTAEAATELEISIDAAKQRYRRALRKLASVLNPDPATQD